MVDGTFGVRNPLNLRINDHNIKMMMKYSRPYIQPAFKPHFRKKPAVLGKFYAAHDQLSPEEEVRAKAYEVIVKNKSLETAFERHSYPVTEGEVYGWFYHPTLYEQWKGMFSSGKCKVELPLFERVESFEQASTMSLHSVSEKWDPGQVTDQAEMAEVKRERYCCRPCSAPQPCRAKRFV